MENASRAFLDVVRKSMREIRRVIGSTTIDPDLLTSAERLQPIIKNAPEPILQAD